MNVTKEQFQEWNENIVTKELRRLIDERLEGYTELVVQSVASGNFDQAQISTGVIRAYRELLEIQWEDTDEDEG